MLYSNIYVDIVVNIHCSSCQYDMRRTTPLIDDMEVKCRQCGNINYVSKDQIQEQLQNKTR